MTTTIDKTETVLSMPVQSFKSLLNSVSFAASDGNSRYAALHTVLLEINSQDGSSQVTAVATDGCRLAHRTLDCTCWDTSGTILIDLKDAKRIARQITRKATGLVKLTKCNGNLLVSWQGAKKSMSYKCSIIDGRFPDWQGVLESLKDRQCATLVGVAGRVAESLKVDIDSVTLNTKNGRLERKSSDSGLTAENPDKLMKVKFNADYLAAWLAVLGEDTPIHIEVCDDGPLSCTSPQGDFVLMPRI